MTFLGISRKIQFSPGREAADADIFEKVSRAIEQEGYDVVRMSEEVLVRDGLPKGLALEGVFQMARSEEALRVLDSVGVKTVNSTDAVRKSRRVEQTDLLRDTDFFPESMVVSTDVLPKDWHSYPCWLKRGDAHSIYSDDIQFVNDESECDRAMRVFSLRGIRTAVLQKHVYGMLVKFYGVKDTGFFEWRPSIGEKDKFGHIQQSVPVKKMPESDLKNVAAGVSEIIGLDVYGGDAVISDKGKVTIIDFNDWPSFSTCADGAALKITELIIK